MNRPILDFALDLFPFDKPYEIQQNFMSAMIDAVVDGKCGVFESPTGTVYHQSILYTYDQRLL